LKNLTFLGSALLWAVLLLFILQQNPLVMQDELVYRLSSLQGLDGGSSYGDYLPSLLLGASGLCGAEFYSCVKVINVAFLLAVTTGTMVLVREFWEDRHPNSIRFLYLTAAPILLYGSLFTPDAMYLTLGFAALILTSTLALRYSPKVLAGLILALSLALLTKPHALLLVALLAMGVFLIGRRKLGFRTALAIAGAVLVAPVLIRLGVGWMIWGEKALNLLGEIYSNYLFARLELAWNVLPESLIASPAGSNFVTSIAPQPTGFIEEIFTQTLLYVAVLVAVLAPAVLMIISKVPMTRNALSAPLSLLGLSAVVLIGFLPLTVAFGSFITINGDPHSNRVLLRYFEFVVLAIYLAALAMPSGQSTRNLRQILPMAATTIVGLLSLVLLQGRISVQPFDSILLSAVLGNPFGRLILSGIIVVLFFLAIMRPSLLTQASVIVFLAFPVLAVATLSGGGRAELTDFEVEAKQRASALASSEGLVVVGVDKDAAQIASFWIGNANSKVFVSPGTVFVAQKTIQDRGSILYLNDEVAITGDFYPDVFRKDPKVISVAEEMLQPLEVPGEQVHRLRGVVASSSLGNWIDGGSMEVELTEIWESGAQLEISFVSVGIESKPMLFEACGKVIPIAPEGNGVITSATLTAPQGFACDSVNLSSGAPDNYVVLTSLKRP
jgi:hypothetical protein